MEKIKMDLTIYKKLLENIRDAFLVNQDGQTKYINSKMLELLGYDKEEEIVGKGFELIIHPDDYPKILTNHLRRLQGEEFENIYEFRVVHKKGEIVPVEIRVIVFEWEGRPATLNFITDITERRKLQQALQESENTYRAIFEHTGTAMAIADEKRRPILVNEQMEKLTGHSREELTSQNSDWSLFTAESDVARLKEFHQLRLINPQLAPEHYEYQIITKNGVKDVFMTSALIPGTKKSSVSMMDITAQKKVESALRKSEERLHELFLNSLDIISIFDKNAIFLYTSPSLLKISDYREADLIGKSCFDFIYPDDLKLASAAFTEVVDQQNKYMVTEFRFRHADGSWIYLEALGNNCLDNPAINGIIINARDVTERKRIESQLLQSQKMEAIGTLAGGIAHDFNNLLMGIQGYVSLMLLPKDSGDPDFDRLNNIQSLVQSGSDLTAKLLGFARGGQYDPKPTNLNELISKTANIFGRTKKEIIIHQKYEKNALPVEADRIQIEQVLINLYVNAWQAMPVGGGDIYIETDNISLSLAESLRLNVGAGDYVRVTITDTGCGMDEKTCRRIFEPFFTTKEKTRGVGLGLASAYGIIREHGGTIEVQSEVGHGTIFSIYLPASTNEVSIEPTKSKSLVRGHETILLIDDESSIIDVCSEILSTLGYNVLQAGNGRDALNIYRSSKDRIDLVILDMIMPGLSGDETFDALRLIDPDVKVMLSTGYSISEQAKNLMEKGCRAFIQKPFRMEDLSQKVRNTLDQK